MRTTMWTHRRRSTGRLALTAATTSLLTLALAAHPAAAEPPDRELRVLDYNIRAGRGLDTDVGGDLGRIADVIAEAGADVVALQEVDRHFADRSDFEDQTAWLADELGMHSVYGPNLVWPGLEEGQPDREYGTAILSRYPILDSEHILLPVHGHPRPAPEDAPVEGDVSEPRGVIKARINVRGVPVNVLSTHLQSDKTAPTLDSAQQQRAEQVQAILADIEADDELTILAGDLNTASDSAELAPLHAAMQDVWLAAGQGPGLTAYLPELDRRIDYIFTSPEIVVDDVEVLVAEESDHLPLVADLSRPGSGVGVGRS